jgi:hypothetical protein
MAKWKQDNAKLRHVRDDPVVMGILDEIRVLV